MGSVANSFAWTCVNAGKFSATCCHWALSWYCQRSFRLMTHRSRGWRNTSGRGLPDREFLIGAPVAADRLTLPPKTALLVEWPKNR